MHYFQAKKWKISFTELNTQQGTLYKVTRRIPSLSVAETKIFKDKEEAKQLLNQWLNDPFQL